MGEQEKESKKLERSISCAISTFASSDMVSSILQSSQTLPVPRTLPSLTISPPIMQARPMKLPAGTTTFKNNKQQRHNNNKLLLFSTCTKKTELHHIVNKNCPSNNNASENSTVFLLYI